MVTITLHCPHCQSEALVRDGDAIIIHGGTTCYLFALRLARRNVKIYTNSMPLAARLWEDGSCHLSLAGGELYCVPGETACGN